MAGLGRGLFLVALLGLCCHASGLFCGQDNCYELLGIKRNATKAEVRRAYRRISSEIHPDTRPNDPKAHEEFRKLGTAYGTLLDDGKRSKYNDFLDNPGKYWPYLLENAREVYAPKSNVFLVVTGIIGIVTLIHWLNMNHTYKETLRRMRESQDFKREVTRLVKSKQAASREEAEAMINLDVVGLEEPDWRNLIIFKIMSLPGQAGKLILWNLNWFFSYRIRKREYSPEDKAYLIRKHMNLSNEDWATVSEKDKKEYMDKELWEKEKCEEFERMRTIELNRLGKGKKKKKHTPVPYSEAEDVVMSE